MTAVGYEFLRTRLGLSALPPLRVAQVMPASRVTRTPQLISVPKDVAPASDSILQHVLFALKHEGTNLQVLAEALPRVPEDELIAVLRASPNGGYIRTACYLWEHFAGRQLQPLPAIGGPTVNLFDPDLYYTGPAQRNARWRVSFNGLGSLAYCATVERSPQIEAALQRDVLRRTAEFASGLGPAVRDRALEWAYLGETEHSFAIERETPTADRARRFVDLLHQAHDGTPLSEDYLVHLQNATLNNPFEHDPAFRTQQNWLSGPGRGPMSITYLPPPPALVPELMRSLMDFVNSRPEGVNPMLLASLTSFGFVYIHPFMDGNGRLSRFLFHKTLCLSRALRDGLLLPVSIAMKRNEQEYLQTLQAYSRPLRERWDVRWIDSETYAFDFRGTESIYRYWDATRCVEFGFSMAEQALDTELRQETEFLQRFDRIYAAVNERFDVRNPTLTRLVIMCLENQGKVSNNRRKQFSGQVPEAIFDFLEEVTRRELFGGS